MQFALPLAAVLLSPTLAEAQEAATDVALTQEGDASSDDSVAEADTGSDASTSADEADDVPPATAESDVAPNDVAPNDAAPNDAALDEAAAREEALQNLPETPSLPGSARPPGLGLAPEAPDSRHAPNGRSPSFGTPLGLDDAAFVISGNFSGWLTAGIGSEPGDATADYEGTPIHVPPIVAGRSPFWRQAELSLFLTYGTPVVQATVGYLAYAGGREYTGFANPVAGPTFSQGYLTVNPDPIGELRVRVLMGAFTENYAGVGQWGWGLFGPMIAVRGYGETTQFDYSVSNELHVTGAAGIMGVPGVPEDFVRGNFTGWTETGISTLAYHGHLGLNYRGQFIFRGHYAGARGTDERVYLTTNPRDGAMDVFALESHWYGVPWGHLGVSAGYWDFRHAESVHDAIWWGVKYTKGAADMLRDYVGTGGNGKVVAVSAEFNTSLARIAWHPRSFDGRSPDIRVTVAGVAHRTLETLDPDFEDAAGYLFGTEVEYQMFRFLSANVRAFGENRSWMGDRWEAYSIAPGFAFRSDWQSPDRIEIWYSRQFYSDVVDNNSAQPLDRDLLAVGVFLGF